MMKYFIEKKYFAADKAPNCMCYCSKQANKSLALTA